ncbi:serine/threonine-protein kinase [Catenulispora subtropica]|uniref:Protein kinase domain-containing protein n=1 Tax=Catenulispora subtropica TaxID=450798 RepID=A0ABN2SLD5_9ACTN
MTPLQPGDPSRISGYRLLGRLGSGGMGHVYLGQTSDGRKVAVKVIRPEFAADPEFRARFRREASAMMAVSSRYTVKVVGADPDGEPAWLASEYVDASALDAAVHKRGPLPVAGVFRLAAGLAEALDTIHRAGLTHRDLKPSNVLLGRDGPRVIDFGLAVGDHSSGVTRTGIVVGTPSYMSPEQIGGVQVGPKSDVYSLGAVLTFAAVGRAPHGDGPVQEVMLRILHQQPNLAGIDDSLLPMIEACLVKDPALRPASSHVLHVLRTLPQDTPRKPAAPPAPEVPPTQPAPAQPASEAPATVPAFKQRIVRTFPPGKHR